MHPSGTITWPRQIRKGAKIDSMTVLKCGQQMRNARREQMLVISSKKAKATVCG